MRRDITVSRDHVRLPDWLARSGGARVSVERRHQRVGIRMPHHRCVQAVVRGSDPRVYPGLVGVVNRELGVIQCTRGQVPKRTRLTRR
jgi:hypothetical protein